MITRGVDGQADTKALRKTLALDNVQNVLKMARISGFHLYPGQ